jgi:hypothetical protein
MSNKSVPHINIAAVYKNIPNKKHFFKVACKLNKVQAYRLPQKELGNIFNVIIPYGISCHLLPMHHRQAITF